MTLDETMEARGGAVDGISIGSVRLQVAQGDLTKEPTDAIVNGTDANLDITQGKLHLIICYWGIYNFH